LNVFSIHIDLVKMRLPKKSISFISAFLIATVCGYSQYDHLRFVQYSEKQGLSTDNVNCIIQDHEGFIWIGTDDGLNKFDGNVFTRYKNNPSDSTSLVHDHILALYLSHDSVLWLGTQYGFCYYRNETDDFHQFNINSADSYIRNFFEDNTGKIYVVNDRGKIFRIQGDSAIIDYQFNIHVYSFLEDSDGNFWFGADEGLYQYDIPRDTMILYRFSSVKEPGKRDIAIFCLLEADNKIWAGTRGEGIFIIDKLTGIVKPFEINLNFIKTLNKDSKGNILIGDTDGLKIFNTRTHKLIEYYPVEKDIYSLASNSVDAIFQDKQQNLWLGVKFGGINIAYEDKGFHFIEYTSKDPFVITKKTITSLQMDKHENLWVGSYTNGLECVNQKQRTSTYIPYGKGPGHLQEGSVYELLIEGNTLWIGTYFGGLQAYDLSTGKFIQYNHLESDPYSIAGNDVRSICKDKEGNFWIITHGTGLNKWDRKSGRFYHFRYDPDDPTTLANDWAFHCICDSRGYIWVATPSGLSVTKDGKSFITYAHSSTDTSSIISSEVFTVFEDSRHEIWAGTRSGLSKFNFSTKSFSHLTMEQGLVDNTVCSILEDRNGNLWIATKNGLSKWIHKSGNFINYDIGDGLQDNEFMENACFKSNTGNMYFGSVNRGTWFHPDSLVMNTRIPDVYITGFKLFNRPVPIENNKDDAILRKNICYTDKIILKHDQKVIGFEFSALNYIHPEKNNYAYKLENFDKEWNYIGNKHEATYTNLTPGKYIFRVKASNNDGFWNEEGTALSIVILPPFWKTWWFRILAAIVFLLITFLVYYIRVRQISALNAHLEKTVEERTQELKSKNEILAKQTRQLHELNVMKDKIISIIGHDLKNPINVIKGFTEIMSDEFDELTDENRRSYLFHISQTVNKTSDLLENLFSWAQSQSGKFNFEPGMVDIPEIVHNNCKLFQESADKKRIRLISHMAEKNIQAYADKNMINTVMRNLISNAIKFTSEHGTITIQADKLSHEGMIKITITDTGLGIPSETVDTLFHIDKGYSTTGTAGETGTGFGLILCREFVEKNGGNIGVKSIHGKGSSFFFTLPASKNKVKISNLKN